MEGLLGHSMLRQGDEYYCFKCGCRWNVNEDPPVNECTSGDNTTQQDINKAWLNYMKTRVNASFRRSRK